MSECISGAVCGQADTYCLVVLSLAVVGGLAAVLVSVLQKLGYSNIKRSHDSPGQAFNSPGV
jgi:hypothetical protein